MTDLVGRGGNEAADATLFGVLRRAQAAGLIGPGSLVPHVQHSEGFLRAAGVVPGRVLDLGSGGGLPGLVLATRLPGCEFVLLDASKQRTRFLQTAVDTLGLTDRVVVVWERAEIAGRDPSLRGSIDLVVARAFGPPGVVAECASGFLRAGGQLVVSEPPEAKADRWSATDALDRLGLVRAASPSRSYEVFTQVRLCDERYPRRVGIPAKRPLF
jgi:16S rRNA (guanine527-N7)-methyltransferase